MKNVDFKKIVENLEIPVVIYDEAGKIVFANNSFIGLYKVQNLEGKNLDEIEGFDKKDFKIKHTEGIFAAFKTEKNKIEETYSDFISTVSHELRTPLTSIRGFADTMLFSYDKLDKAQIQKFLEIIKEQSNRLIKLIENLLSVTKMSSENENLVYKGLNVKNQLEKIIYIFKNQYKDRNISYSCPDGLLPILADESKFQQIMINLLDNAVKYSPEGGEIKVSAQDSKIENCIDINIKDSGIGISSENIEKIFDKFVRVENHLTRKAQGSGLGLYIVKNLVEKMGGKITAESEPQKGSTFCVTLPSADYTTQSGKKILESA